MEPSNTDLGLHVGAGVYPALISLGDSAAALSIRVIVSNPSDHDVIVETGGPPFLITGDPSESRGLSGSFRIASAMEALNAGPGVDWWGGAVDTFQAHHTPVLQKVLTLREWKARGWAVTPGVYRVRSYYNSHEGESQNFVVRP
jgi:hypothetical protein